MTIRTLLNDNGGQGVITIESRRTVGEAIWILRRARTRALVVTDDGHRILGLVSGHDLIRTFKSHGVDPLIPLTVADIMERNVATCPPDESLRTAMARMAACRQAHVVVVEDGRPCGVIGLAEIIRSRLHEAKADVDALYGTRKICC